MENEEFVCKIKFKKGALDNIEVLEGDEQKCRELFKKSDSLKSFFNTIPEEE